MTNRCEGKTIIQEYFFSNDFLRSRSCTWKEWDFEKKGRKLFQGDILGWFWETGIISKIQEVVVVNKMMKILEGKGIFFKNILKVLERKKKILFLFYQKQQKFRKINISALFYFSFISLQTQGKMSAINPLKSTSNALWPFPLKGIPNSDLKTSNKKHGISLELYRG